MWGIFRFSDHVEVAPTRGECITDNHHFGDDCMCSPRLSTTKAGQRLVIHQDPDFDEQEAVQ